MRRILFSLVLVALFYFTVAKQWHLVDIDSDDPFPRVGMGLAPISDVEFLFFAGGLENISGTNEFYNDLWLFDFEKEGFDFEGDWHLLSPDGPIPSTRALPAMDVVEKSNGEKVVVVFGGGRFDNIGNIEIPTDSLYTYDVVTETWTDRSSITGGPSPRLGSLGVGYENKFYVHAGVDASFGIYNDLWVFDIDTLSWSEITPSTSVRPPATISPVGDILRKNAHSKRLVVTSGTVDGFAFTDKTTSFDFNTNAWTDVTNTNHNYSPERTFTVATASRNRKDLLMYGGDHIGGVAGCGNFAFDNPSNDTWSFNGSNDQWKEETYTETEHPIRLKRHGAVQVDKYFFVLGGYDFVCPGPGQVHNEFVHVTQNN